MKVPALAHGLLECPREGHLGYEANLHQEQSHVSQDRRERKFMY